MPLPSDALYYAEKVLVESFIPRYFGVKSSTEQGSFADSNDGSIVERRQHLHSWSDFFYCRSTNEKCVEWRFS